MANNITELHGKPLFETSFGKASARLGGQSRMPMFSANQVLYLHYIHTDLINQGVLSVMSLDYAHNFCRATFDLQAPKDEAATIRVSLTEHRTAAGLSAYEVSSSVNDMPASRTDFKAQIADRNSLPLEVATRLRSEMTDLNARIFVTPGSSKVAVLTRWKNRSDAKPPGPGESS